VVLTDKTGTLTSGKPKIEDVQILGKYRKNTIMEYLGMAAINSSHPVDTAIIEYVKGSGVKIMAPDDFLEKPGEGLIVRKGNLNLHIGKIEFLKAKGVTITHDQQVIIDTYKNNGFSLSALAVNRHLAALVIFEDEIKPYARSVVSETKKLGVLSWMMITGDNENVATRIARLVGVDAYKFNVTPQEKLVYAKDIKHKTRGVMAMIGDGVNDAAALALADVSISMGAIGSDAAIEAADVALMNDRLERIPEAMIIGREAMKIVRQNFIIWGITNVLGLLLVITGVLHPVGASTFNFVTDFFPILNALRIGMQKIYPTS
jgi:P-type E1-E2 ATPase